MNNMKKWLLCCQAISKNVDPRADINSRVYPMFYVLDNCVHIAFIQHYFVNIDIIDKNAQLEINIICNNCSTSTAANLLHSVCYT
jgi:hypothetical protein